MASQAEAFLPFVRIEPIDRTVGIGNGKFLGDVANGMRRSELEKRFRAGEYPDLHSGLAKEAMKYTPTPRSPA
ncbi:hypothetical protein [Novosphingobium sp. JCM 18896]|uniref:hypothetical protein n=1 Tax=Novosphingobium sp. JCM 18896 TaxID=2989731 RepID=UPI0022226504|nr:hypothetical protein [Novosphingobium sp. JCM 18896]MCW1431383.1 hypothetical protein [Novosphingobium sp. JCM 18896]